MLLKIELNNGPSDNAIRLPVVTISKFNPYYTSTFPLNHCAMAFAVLVCTMSAEKVSATIVIQQTEYVLLCSFIEPCAPLLSQEICRG